MRLRPSLLVAPLIVALAAPVSVLADPVATSSASAPAASTPPKAKPPKPTPDPNQVICRDDRPLGSHIGVNRTCMTRAQWEDVQRLTAAQLNQTVQQGEKVNPGPHM